MRAIVAVDLNWGIGSDNALLWHISEDLKFFKKMTENKVVILGRKTLETFPGKKPLKNRRHLLLSKTLKIDDEQVEVFDSVSEVVDTVKDLDSTMVFVIGGQSIYEQFLPYCKRVYVTQIEAVHPQTDRFFPNLTQLEDWVLVEQSDDYYFEDNEAIKYHFDIYDRR